LPTPRPRRRSLAAVLAASPLLAACGDAEDEEAAGTTPSTAAEETTDPSTAPSSTVPASADPARKAKAEAAVLKKEDFPAGWDEHDPTQGLALELTWNDLLDCLGVEKSPDQPLGIAVSPTFLQGVGTQVRSTVEYVSEARSQELAAVLTSGDFVECATEVFTEDAARSAPEGGQPGPLTVAPLDFAPLGQSTSATRINFEMKVGDLPIPISQDLIVVFEGGTVSRFSFLNPGGPFAPNLQRTLVEAVVGRN
jgi:hypothetical protein